MLSKWGVFPHQMGPQIWGNNLAEASSTGGERIPQRQNKGESSLLKTRQNSGRKDSRREVVSTEAVGGGSSYREKMRSYGDVWNSPFFGNCV